MDTETFLPLALRLKSSDTAYAPTESVIAHLMPFSIDYTGPAPVDTFFLSQPIDAESGDGSSEAVSAFRGRRVYGTRLELPESYRLGFFCVQEETITDETEQEPAPSKQRKQAKTRPVQPPVPVRGSRFALDDEDEDEGEAYDVGVPFGEPREPLSEDDDYGDVSRLSTQLAPTKHSLRPVADAGSSLWVWGPDGPIDAGDDAYIRTCNEWLQVIAPSVCAHLFSNAAPRLHSLMQHHTGVSHKLNAHYWNSYIECQFTMTMRTRSAFN